MGCRQLKGKLALSAFMEHVFVCIIVLLFMVILAALSLNLSIFSPFGKLLTTFPSPMSTTLSSELTTT